MAQKQTQKTDPVMPFYMPIDPKGDYSGKDVVRHVEDFRDLGEYLRALQQDPENPGVFEDSGKLLRSNPNYYFEVGRSPRSDLELALSKENDRLGEYAERHSSTLLGKLRPEDYVQLVQMVPLYKTGKKKHDNFVELMNEHKKIAEASKDPEKMAAYVGKKVRGFPEWAQISYMRHGKSDLDIIFKSYAIFTDGRLKETMFDEKGSPRSGFLEGVFKDSLSEGIVALSEGKSQKERRDIRKKNLTPYFMALLEKAYEREKVEEYEHRPREKKKEDKRKEIRRAKGMPF